LVSFDYYQLTSKAKTEIKTVSCAHTALWHRWSSGL